jgi:polyhydroxyalkanoate synthase
MTEAMPARRAPADDAAAGIEAINAFPAGTESADRLMHALEGRWTNGLSPSSLILAYLDWAVHLSNAPGKVLELVHNAMAKGFRFLLYASGGVGGEGAQPFITPLPQDVRFSGDGWQRFPYNLFSQTFLLSEQWWHYATSNVRGVSPHHQDVVGFTARQILDLVSPSNFPLTNPEVVRATREEGGDNLLRGARKFLDDLGRAVAGLAPEGPGDYQPGINLACTPGKVVFRNRLIELIQYAPTTATVAAEPVLFVPAWIMKYYILDLSPHNSMVRYLLSRGHTVFMISWRNPGPAERNIGMDDYLRMGVMESLSAIGAICPDRQVHGVGYCLGGTLLSIAAAAMARDGDQRLKTATLLAAQTDFTEAGEIMLFIDESQVTFLEDIMWDQGYLDTRQMAGAFQMLRPYDLIWSRLVKEYLLGQAEHPNDLMAWNADATRMPARMHSQYLRHLFLDNQLSKGHYLVYGRPVALTDIRVPLCVVATRTDHVAPWQSVFKIGLLADTEITYILTSGGHNAGIVSEPGHPHRSYRMSTHREVERYVDPDTWLRITALQDGSWWPAWADWLGAHSSGQQEPPPLGLPEGPYRAIYDAPGDYVKMP